MTTEVPDGEEIKKLWNKTKLTGKYQHKVPCFCTACLRTETVIESYYLIRPKPPICCSKRMLRIKTR